MIRVVNMDTYDREGSVPGDERHEGRVKMFEADMDRG